MKTELLPLRSLTAALVGAFVMSMSPGVSAQPSDEPAGRPGGGESPEAKREEGGTEAEEEEGGTEAEEEEGGTEAEEEGGTAAEKEEPEPRKAEEGSKEAEKGPKERDAKAVGKEAGPRKAEEEPEEGKAKAARKEAEPRKAKEEPEVERARPKKRGLERGRRLAKPKKRADEGVVDPVGGDAMYSTVVVSGLRPEVVLDSPRSVEVMTRQEMFRRAGRTTPELLVNIPSVVVQKTNHGGGSPFIRGFTGQHVLYLIDGIRLNNSTTRYGPNQALNTVDPFTIRRLEILRGPGSVLYGSDAIGGTIQMLTREAPMIPGAGFRFGGSAIARFGSADRSQVYNLGVWAQHGIVGVHVGGSFKDFNELTGGRGIGKQDYTGYGEGDWDGSVKVLLSDDWVLKMATFGVRQYDVPRTDKSSPEDYRYFTNQFRELTYAKLSGAHGEYLDRFDATLSYQRHTELRHRYRLDRDRVEREWDRVHTAGVSVTAGTDLGRYSKLTYGVDFYHDWVFSTGRRRTISTGEVTYMSEDGFRGRFVDGSEYTQAGVFIYDQIKPFDWWVIHLGGRLAITHAYIPVDPLAAEFGFESEKISETMVGPVAGGSTTFIPAKWIHLIASVHQGFRAPNLDDYSHVGSEGPAFDVPSPNLNDPERSTTLEAGAKLAWRRISASVFGHYTFLRDFIARRYTGEQIDGEPAAVRANAAKGHVAGVEGMVSVRFPKGFSATSWVSWTRGDVTMPFQDPRTQPIRRMSPLQGAVAVAWRSPEGMWADVLLRWSARQDRLSPGDLNDARICPDGPVGCEGTPGFAIIDVAGGLPLGRYADFMLRIHNLTNEPYKYHGSGVFGPGVSAIGQVRIKY
jgi:outer membrane receptor protein involved in Fe transport